MATRSLRLYSLGRAREILTHYSFSGLISGSPYFFLFLFYLGFEVVWFLFWFTGNFLLGTLLDNFLPSDF